MAVEGTRIELKTSRIEALSDNVFAFSLTILIVGFDILIAPQKNISEPQLFGILYGLLPDFLHYVEGFVIIGAFWLEHHQQFHYIKRTNPKLLFINIAGLMFIALIPFSTTIAGDYGELYLAALLFELNLLMAGLVMYAQWSYATSHKRLVDASLDKHTIDFHKRRNLIIPIVSLVAISISHFNPRVGTVLYFIVPFLLIFHKDGE